MINLEGKKCPAFQGECTNNKTFSNKDFSNKNLVIYFYPKDSTPGCTTEGQDFRDNYKEFKKYDTEILGVSRDSVKSHENFKSKQSFPFELLSDPDEKMCNALHIFSSGSDNNSKGKDCFDLKFSCDLTLSLDTPRISVSYFLNSL